MVDQLWLWFVKGEDNKPDTIITSFPSREGAAHPQLTREADDLQSTVLDRTNRKSISESTDLVSRILSEEEETRLFRHFRRRANTLHSLHERHRTYSEHRSMLLKKLLDILKESRLLKEIKDILDEIKMIRSVLKDQYKVVESLQEMVEPHHSPHGIDASRIHTKKFSDILMLIRATDESFDVMDAHAKQVEKGIEHLLDLKQKQANLWEARSSREGAEEAAKQGKTILVFTIITIIFVVGVSFAVSIPFVILAFNIGKFSEVWSRITHSANKYTAFILLKPLRGSQRLPSRHIRSKCQEWYREWVNFIAKHDLPLKPDEEMEAQLKREMDDRQAPEGETPDTGFYTDSSSDGEVTDDEEELDLAVRQTERQINLLQWMRG
ncbi:hypothetical protein SLS58_002229 [Diplodia intermedia]|uniref:Ankyrin repeat protein n=1 Tax=Diplodia intermedia TaxID=856260 RepID=A0ABR3U0W9_9PEZI